MYDRILVPVGGSEGSERVAAHAAELAERTGAALAAVHVVAETTSDAAMSEEAAEKKREAGEEALEAVAGVADGYDVDYTTELRRGTPETVIVEYADEVGADLIVMGSHGRTGLKRYVLGSVTEHVLRAADQPVLAVKLDTLTVTDEGAAREAAAAALVEAGQDLAGLREDPYQERTTWVVPAVTDDGRDVNVHVDAVSGEARVADLE